MSDRSAAIAAQGLVVAGLAAAVAAADQATKAIVTRTLGPGGEATSLDLIGRWFSLQYVENRGAAFGLLGDRGAVVTALAAAVLVAVLVYFRRETAKSPWLVGAIGLVAGGAIGNLIDRVGRGFVVDFVRVGPWPTFNLADVAITLGVGLLVVHYLRVDAVGIATPHVASDTAHPTHRGQQAIDGRAMADPTHQ